MNADRLLYEIVDEKLGEIEREGVKIKLKTLRKRLALYTLIFGVLFLFFLLVVEWTFLAFVFMCIYFMLLYVKVNNTEIVANLAKKSPDTPISEIIKGDMI